MQTRFTSIFTRAAMTLLLMLLTTVTAWAQDPASIGSIQYNSTLGAYEINSVANLNDLAVFVNGAGTYSTSGDETTVHSCEGLTFKQTANITYTGTDNYTPIGLYVNNDGFRGTFDGQGNTISGIDCTGDGLTGEVESLGLFGYNQGTIKNVTLSGCRFASANNENYSNNYAIYVDIGSIAGINKGTGTISNCTVTGGTISRTRTANANRFETYIGGIAGDNTGSITECTYSGSVSGTYSGNNEYCTCTIQIGGIAGSSANGGSITGCGSDAAVSCSAPNISTPCLQVGGIAGLNNGARGNATVSDCFFSGTLSGTGGGSTSDIYIGAFVGKSINSSIVTNNYYYGDYAATIGHEEGGNGTLANLVRVYQLTGNSITATAPEGSGTTFKGVSYFKADATVTLGYTGEVPVDKSVRYSYNDGSEDHDVSGKTFEMPSSNVTVTATLSAKPTNTDAITYVDADDRRKTKDAGTVYILDGLEGTLGQDDADTWYVVNSNVTYTTGLTLNGNVHLILADGKTMTVTNTSGTGISGTGNFAIYARDFDSFNYGSLVVTGSTHGISCSGNVTINGGKVEAVSTGSAADGCYGIKADGDITLGWTCEGDNITASSYSGNTVRIADGWTLTYKTKIGKDDVTNCCSGTLSTDEIAAIAGKTLTPLTVVNCSGSVAWNDNGNLYGIRPDAVTLLLYKNGDNDEIATTSATAADGWRFSIGEGNYPSFVTNGDIKTPEVFTIKEDAVDGYSADISSSYYGFTITNTLVTSGTCGKTANDNVTWEVTDTDGDDTYDKLTISGTGRMANYNSSNQPWAAFKSDITTAVIEDGVTRIGMRNFYQFTALTSVSIASSVTIIDPLAFSECTNLATISGATGVTYVGSPAFFGTAWLDALYNAQSDGLTYVGHVAYLFKGTDTSVNLDAGTTQIYDNCFLGSQITSIIIPASVTTIGDQAFAHSDNLQKIYVLRSGSGSSDITQLGQNAFYECHNLTAIIVPADAYNYYKRGYWNSYISQIQPGYTITCEEGITATTDGPLVVEYEVVTLSHNDRTGYDFGGYSVKDSENCEVVVDEEEGVYTFQMPASDVTVSAAWTPSENVALTANEADGNMWTTFFCGDAGYDITTENACAYTAKYNYDDSTSPATETLTLHKLGTAIAKGEAVIIVSKTSPVSLTKGEDGEKSATNDLRGVDVRTLKSTLGTGTFYVMGSTAENGFGFHKYNAEYMPARKAYLLLDGGIAQASSLTMVFEETTSIVSIDNGQWIIDNKADTWYSLDGRKLDKQPTAKGIYIHNGRKEVVR